MKNLFKRNSSSLVETESRVFERNPELLPGTTGDSVKVGAATYGRVLRRSPRFVVWAEAAEEVHVGGDGMPSTRVARMWEGPRGAAISEDELWCAVIGLGFIAFPLHPGSPIRSHWRYPVHARWELHLPMTGDLVDATLFTGVRALDGHRFALSTHWGLGNAWTIREWIYDADADTIGHPHDIINVAKQRHVVRPDRG